MARLALLVVMTAVLCGCGAKPTSVERPAKHRCTVLAVNYCANEHLINVDINGERFASFAEKSNGFTMNDSPLTDGTNAIRVSFAPYEDMEHWRGGSLEMIFGSMEATAEDIVPRFSVEEVYGFCEVNAEVTIEDGIPARISFTRKDWADKARQTQTYEKRADGDMYAPVHEMDSVREWTWEGQLLSERELRGGKLTAAKCYRSDGSVGATVVEGAGNLRWWHDDGTLDTEIPIIDGKATGVRKSYYPGGALRQTITLAEDMASGEAVLYDEAGRKVITGTYKDDVKHGTWVRYGKDGTPAGRSEFRDGQIQTGTDFFTEFD